jgi:hypothetical protein
MGVSDEAKNVIPLKYLRKIKNKNVFPLVNSIRGHTVYKCKFTTDEKIELLLIIIILHQPFSPNFIIITYLIINTIVAYLLVNCIKKKHINEKFTNINFIKQILFISEADISDLSNIYLLSCLALSTFVNLAFR